MVGSDGACKLFYCINDRVGRGELFNCCGGV